MTSFDDASPYFLYSGGYDTTVVGKQKMKVRDFLTMMFDDGVEPGTVVYQLFGIRSLDGQGAAMLDRFDHAVRERSTAATEPRFSGIWVGSPGATTPLHHDAWPGLLFQTHGTKRVAMYRPADRTNLSFCLPLRGEGRWSELPGRSDDASPADFPRLARAASARRRTPPWRGALHPAVLGPRDGSGRGQHLGAVPVRRASHLVSDPGFLRPASEMLRKQLDTIAAR